MFVTHNKNKAEKIRSGKRKQVSGTHPRFYFYFMGNSEYVINAKWRLWAFFFYNNPIHGPTLKYSCQGQELPIISNTNQIRLMFLGCQPACDPHLHFLFLFMRLITSHGILDFSVFAFDG